MVKNALHKEPPIEQLKTIMSQLRDKELGCPWDIQQRFETIAPYTIEEAYEVADAIQRSDLPALREELGDLLFQVVFHSQMAAEQNVFDFDDVVHAICDKLTRRHPHVFAGQTVDEGSLNNQWERHKGLETKQTPDDGLLTKVNVNQPAINQAFKLQKKAASVGFDWPSLSPVFDKLVEEVDELKEEIFINNNHQRIEEELGDVLFSCVNIARHLNVNAEWSLRKANQRFVERFSYIEKALNESGETLENCSIDRLNTLWEAAKKDT